MSKYLVDLRVALFQLNPQVGQLEQNIERTWNLVHGLKSILDRDSSKYPQLVVFPEFALTGYSFHSKEQIKPYVSVTHNSRSFKFAQSVSKLFRCYTVIGYSEESMDANKHGRQVESVLHNSALVTDPSGNLTFNYRKSFLYDTEYEWGCQENPQSFQKFTMVFEKCAVEKNGTVAAASASVTDIELNASIGICMDLNPYKFEAPFNDFEFSSFCLDNNVDLIICPMAWLHSKSITKHDHDLDTINWKLESIRRSLDTLQLPIHGSQGVFQIDMNKELCTQRRISREDPLLSDSRYDQLEKPDMENVNYWILRFLPFLNLDIRKRLWYRQFIQMNGSTVSCERSYMGMSKEKSWAFEGRNSVLLLCNRCGIEDDGKTIFAGSSGIYKFNGKTARSDNDYETNIDSLNESVDLLGNLGKGLEGVIMRDIEFEVTK